MRRRRERVGAGPAARVRRLPVEVSACGDLGTFIPHVIGAMTVAGLAPFGVLFGFASFLIATGAFYGLPLPVQPMKAISAVILTGGLQPGEVRRRHHHWRRTPRDWRNRRIGRLARLIRNR